MIHFLILVRSPTRVEGANKVSAETCALGSTLLTTAGLASALDAAGADEAAFDAPGCDRAGRLARFGGIARRNYTSKGYKDERNPHSGQAWTYLAIEFPVFRYGISTHQRDLGVLLLLRWLLTSSFLVLCNGRRSLFRYRPFIHNHTTTKLVPRSGSLITRPLSLTRSVLDAAR